MSIRIEPYNNSHVQLVKDFNRRLEEGGDIHRFPESPVPTWLPHIPGVNLFQEYFVASDEEAVRGGYIIKYQDFYFNGIKKKTGCLQLPLSEGIIDKRFSNLGVQLIFDALEKEPHMFALGIGSYNESYAQFLLKLKWQHYLVPFFFKILNPIRIIKGL
jgi:hypothetical protein